MALAFVLTAYADFGAALDSLPRPIVVAGAAAVLIQMIGFAILRNATRASLLAIAVLASLFDVRFAVVALAGVNVWLLATRMGRRLSPAPLVAIVLVLFAIAAVRTVASPTFDLNDFARGPRLAGPASGAGGPDIYLILLDGYPRSDTFAEFGFDNGRFEEALATRGFEISANSRTNYPYTSLVLASMLHMRHIPEIEALASPPPAPIAQHRAIFRALTDPPALAHLQERGYWAANSGYPASVGALRTANGYKDDGRLTIFELQLLYGTDLWDTVGIPLGLAEHRARVRSVFDWIEATAAERRSEPTFMLAHVLSPHTPIVFDEHGNDAALACECFPFAVLADEHKVELAAFYDAYGRQTEYINGRTLAAVDKILAASPGAVVIIFSDHGARASTDRADEWYQTFFAARTPDRPRLFGDTARPIEIFPRLFSAYFGEELPLPADISFTPTKGLRFPLELEPWELGSKRPMPTP